jgi:uncharacterized membrane protein YkvA (DUF1232 family)
MSFLRRLRPDRLKRIITILPLLARLAWRLARDERVPKKHKAVLLAAVGYVVSPVDIAMDPIPLVGRLDDLLIVAGGVAWALRFAPAEAVEEHLAELGITRAELEDTLLDLLPLPAQLVYERRHHVLPLLERGAHTGLRALIGASERLADAVGVDSEDVGAATRAALRDDGDADQAR